MNTVVLAAGAGDATKTINIGLTGNLGSTAADSAARLSISNDVGGGTAAAPNLTYGTWSITAANTSNLQLNPAVTTNGAGVVISQGGVGGAKSLALAGAGTIAVGQAAAGDWQLLTTVDMSKGTGTEFVTGATSGVASQARASAGNPGWFFGSEVGLLNEGAGRDVCAHQCPVGQRKYHRRRERRVGRPGGSADDRCGHRGHGKPRATRSS